MNLVDELHAIAAALTAEGIRYAICGGVAVTIHGATRSTVDLDVLVERADLPRALEAWALGARHHAERHGQRVSKPEGDQPLLLDLLLAEAAFAGTLDDRVELALPAGPLAVVSRATLVRMKRLAGRAQDLADLGKLEAADEG